ncbi:MAG: hypothetical protein WD060_07260 [Pirellulales bacterium]
MTARSLRPPLCVAALAWAAVAPAAPLDLASVPAKAQWVMHLDMDAARDSTVMERAWQRAVTMHPHAEQMMRMGAGMMGMDPRKDLRDITAYGLDTDKRNGAMIVRAKANRAMLEKMVEKAPGHETMEHREYKLHAWTHKGWKGRGGEKVVGAFFRDDVMVFARTPDMVKAALDVLDGNAKSAAGDSPLGGRVRPGSILVARASAVDPDTKCPVLRQGRAFRVAIGESAGQSFYRAKLEMKSDEAADQAEDVVEGMESLARLGWGDEAAAMKLVDGLTTETQGSTCMIAWNAPADDVWAVVEKMADRWEQKRKDWMKSRGGKDGGGCDKAGCKGCDKCQDECPMKKKGDSKKDEGTLRDDEF